MAKALSAGLCLLALVPEATTQVIATVRGDTIAALAPDSRKAVTFDPSLSSRITDPLYRQLRAGWHDKNKGRAAYNKMYEHPAVSAPFDTLIAFLKSYTPVFKPAGTNPTALQRQLADFSNEQIRRLGSSGDSRQGYEKFVEWIGQGLFYGFSIAEVGTVFHPWSGQRRIQVERINPLPQSSLDLGYDANSEARGFYLPSAFDAKYRCFEMDDFGRILAIHQYYKGEGDTENRVSWRGSEMLGLLHFTHGGGENNPFGQSIFYTAFSAWGALYSLELMEDAFLDSSLPYLTASYKTPDGRPSPEMHAQFLTIIQSQDPSIRALIMPDTTFSSVAPSNPSFTEHITKKKAELRKYILDCILGIPVMGSDTSGEIDSRTATTIFFERLMPAILREVETVLTWQFSRRLIDTNWSNVGMDDYPRCEFSSHLGNDLRIAMPMLQQILPYVNSSRLGEFLESTLPGFDANWIPEGHEASVMEERAPSDPAVGVKTGKGPGTGGPLKAEGTPDTRSDDTQSTIGNAVKT